MDEREAARFGEAGLNGDGLRDALWLRTESAGEGGNEEWRASTGVLESESGVLGVQRLMASSASAGLQSSASSARSSWASPATCVRA